MIVVPRTPAPIIHERVGYRHGNAFRLAQAPIIKRRRRSTIRLLMDCLGRSAEAEQAVRKAMENDPANDSPRLNLIFLLRDLTHVFHAARRLLSELAAPNQGKDPQALHEALLAAYEGNWRSARESLRSALAEIADSLPVTRRDDWYRASVVLVHLGFGPQLLEFLVEQGADVRLMPWFDRPQSERTARILRTKRR